MIKSSSNRIFHELKAGIQTAVDAGESVLFSWNEVINPADPVHFYYNCQQNFNGQRFYWSSPEGLLLAGAGETVKLQASGEKRFDDIIKKSREFLKDHALKTQLEAAKPVFFGGYSFNAVKSAEDHLWADFHPAVAIMPEWMLAFSPKDNQWKLQFNIIASPSDKPEDLFNYYEAMKRHLLSAPNTEENKRRSYIKTHEPGIDQWLNSVARAIEEIKNNRLEKVVLSRLLSAESDHDYDIPGVIQSLQAYKKDSYLFAIERGESTFIGASPERLIEKSDHVFRTMCLAGTASRSKDAEEDEALGVQLLRDHKNLSEHQMVVNMITQSMKEICSEVSYPAMPSILKAKSVQHLYTPVEARETEAHHILELVKRLHPTPAMGGVPIEQALKVINEKESYERGLYASPIGWFDEDGNGEFAVGIRSALFKRNKATLFAGCGIVSDSDPISEKEETKMKFRPMMQAIGGK